MDVVESGSSTSASETPPTAPAPPAPDSAPTTSVPTAPSAPSTDPPLRRSTRTITAPKILTPNDPRTYLANAVMPAQLPYHLDFNFDHPLSFKAAHSDPDILYYDQAMSGPDRDKWIEAAVKEIRGLESMGTWIEVPRSAAKKKVVPMTWVFRIKRTPDGLVDKYKARICVMGNKMDEYTQETFAPVVAWPTVRIFLVLANLLRWYTCAIDFTSAFLHAYLDEPLWVQMPRGFKSSVGEDAILELKRSCYGTSFAPKLWFELLRDALLDLGFTQSSYDPCMFFKSDMILVAYVDNAGIAAKDESLIFDLIEKLKDKGFTLTKEDDFSSYLGIKVKLAGDKISMSQQGLIEKIQQATQMETCNPNTTPSQSAPLGAHPDAPPFQESWDYSSIVGMLIYLATNSRPDISFAVSQVARFNHHPREPHGKAVKTIIRYLAGTKDQGTSVTLSNSLNIDTFVDADFAGLYKHEPDAEPTSAKSRLGYIVFLAGCPLVWKSQLQQEIALSTAESEYASLSIAMKTVIPIQNIVREVATYLALPQTLDTTIHSRVFEDNNAALQLATEQHLTNRTRYYHVKWHWFWHHVRNGTVEIVRIASAEQRADIFTKPLPPEVFKRLRLLNQGW